MKYALGNMLNGAGGLNADQLALDLQFAADKTLTARRGPTPVLTRGSTGTFVGSNGLIQTAAVNAARFDHDPVSPFACRGLLIEEGRTNLALQSEGFSTGSWSKSGSTVTADSIASPDGAVTADLLNEDSGLSTHVTQQAAPSLTAGQPYTFSVFAKAGSHTSFQIGLSTTAFGALIFANFVLTGSGSVGTSSGVTTSIQSYPNGWYRCNVTIASVSGGAGGFVVIVANNNNSSSARLPSYQGTGAQVVYLWGAQLEAGSFATSYIPTTTSALARSADVCSITGANFTGMYNQPEGTYQINYSFIPGYSVVGSSTTLVQASNNNFNDLTRVGSALGSLNQRFDTISGGTLTRITSSNSQSLTAQNKISAAYKVGSNAMSLNGGSVATGSPVGITSLATRLDIGSNHDASSKMNGHIAVFRYYKKRLDNAKLVSLTV